MDMRAVKITYTENEKFIIQAQESGAQWYCDKKHENYIPAGPDPLELFLSGLGSCLGVYARRYLVNHAIAFTRLSVQVRADFTSESPARLVHIYACVSTDAHLDEPQREVFFRYVNSCPVHNTLLHNEHITVETEVA